MVKLTRIYTRTGDTGTTGLGDGSRVQKHGARVAAYGTVDEANAVLGIAALHLPEGLRGAVSRVQNDLFDVGADLCTPEQEAPQHQPLRVTEPQIRWLEQEIDRMNADLPALRSFVLPGGSAAAAYLHQARTVVRRAERDISALAAEEAINPLALTYMNRLSDWLFVAARHVNHSSGEGDVLWQPGQNREG